MTSLFQAGLLGAAQANFGDTLQMIHPADDAHYRVSAKIQDRLDEMAYNNRIRELQGFLNDPSLDPDPVGSRATLLDPESSGVSREYDPALDAFTASRGHLLSGGEWPIGASALLSESDLYDPMSSIGSRRRSIVQKYFGD